MFSYLKVHGLTFVYFSVDVFLVDISDVGPVTRIRVQHDNSGFFGPGWYLKKVYLFLLYCNSNPQVFHDEVFYCTYSNISGLFYAG